MDSGQSLIEIENISSEKDLGVIVDQALDFSEHITKINKANHFCLRVIDSWNALTEKSSNDTLPKLF